MTTEHCMQQPTNRTQSFARSLHERLCSLSGADQDTLDSAGHRLSLSSSSEDVFYDLDSSPGSPAEVAADGFPLDRLVINHEQENLSSSLRNIWQNGIPLSNEQPCKPVSLDKSCVGLNDGQWDISAENKEIGSSFSSDSCFKDPSNCCNLNELGTLTTCEGGNEETIARKEVSSDICVIVSAECSTLAKEGSCDQNAGNQKNVFENLNSFNSGSGEDNSERIQVDVQSVVTHRNHEHNISSHSEDWHNGDPSELVREDVNYSRLEEKNHDSMFTEMGCLHNLLADVSINEKQHNDCVTIDEPLRDGVDSILSCDTSCPSIRVEEEEMAIELTATDSHTLVQMLRGSYEKEKSFVGAEDEENIETRRAKFRRCSSLKTGKTPPGTPGQKKIVRFADCYGLDLAAVRMFLDDIPRIPRSAFEDLNNAEVSDRAPSVAETLLVRPDRTVVPLFTQPGGLPDFLDHVQRQQVSLENAIVTDKTLFAITGTVRVRNLDFNKSVHVRYTIDNWASYSDLQARYVPNSCDGFSDMFTFQLFAHTLNIGQRLEFAVRFQVRGAQYWDSNGGANYAFQCVPLQGADECRPPRQETAAEILLETWGSFY